MAAAISSASAPVIVRKSISMTPCSTLWFRVRMRGACAPSSRNERGRVDPGLRSIHHEPQPDDLGSRPVRGRRCNQAGNSGKLVRQRLGGAGVGELDGGAPILAQRRQASHDVFLADLHGPADAVILLQAGVDQIPASRYDAGSRGVEALVPAIDDKIGAGGVIFVQIRFGRGIHDDRHVAFDGRFRASPRG